MTHLKAVPDARPDSTGSEVEMRAAVDPRVAAVLEVLGGDVLVAVAHRRSVDPAVLRRWCDGFVTAGSAHVTNEPSFDEARQRDRFLAAFAHEMRTPLGVATGWTSMLRSGVLPAPAVPGILDKLDAALKRLTDRTLDVELMAACALGRLKLHPEVVDVNALVQHFGEVTQVRTADEMGDEKVSVVADPDHFPRVLRDLWDASGLAPHPRERHFEIAVVGSWVEFRAVRAADPVDPGVLAALFDPFDINDDATGVTIGLYLARALTVAHGGTLGVDQDDNGATLWVRLPRCPVHETRPVHITHPVRAT